MSQSNRHANVLIRIGMADGSPPALLPSASVLDASIRRHHLCVLLRVLWQGLNELPCGAAAAKHQKRGWFEHGSTTIVFMPPGFRLALGIQAGRAIRRARP